MSVSLVGCLCRRSALRADSGNGGSAVKSPDGHLEFLCGARSNATRTPAGIAGAIRLSGLHGAALPAVRVELDTLADQTHQGMRLTQALVEK